MQGVPMTFNACVTFGRANMDVRFNFTCISSLHLLFVSDVLTLSRSCWTSSSVSLPLKYTANCWIVVTCFVIIFLNKQFGGF